MEPETIPRPIQRFGKISPIVFHFPWQRSFSLTPMTLELMVLLSKTHYKVVLVIHRLSDVLTFEDPHRSHQTLFHTKRTPIGQTYSSHFERVLLRILLYIVSDITIGVVRYSFIPIFLILCSWQFYTWIKTPWSLWRLLHVAASLSSFPVSMATDVKHLQYPITDSCPLFPLPTNFMLHHGVHIIIDK